MAETAKCELCGEPMPPGETMFKYHGYSGPCPKPPSASREQDPANPTCVHCGEAYGQHEPDCRELRADKRTTTTARADTGGERERIIEQCAKVAEKSESDCGGCDGCSCQRDIIAAEIRKLAPAATQPTPAADAGLKYITEKGLQSIELGKASTIVQQAAVSEVRDLRQRLAVAEAALREANMRIVSLRFDARRAVPAEVASAAKLVLSANCSNGLKATGDYHLAASTIAEWVRTLAAGEAAEHE